MKSSNEETAMNVIGLKTPGLSVLLVLLGVAAGCASQQDELLDSSQAAPIQAALTPCGHTFTIQMPPGVARESLALASSDALTIADGSALVTPAGRPAAASNTGTGTLSANPDVRTGDLFSRGPITLAD